MNKIINKNTLKKIDRSIRNEGLKGFAKKGFRYIKSGRDNYALWREQNLPSDEELNRQRDTIFDYSPKISIVVPAYKTSEKFFQQLLQSVLNQTYKNWELCIADASNLVIDIEDKRIKHKVLNSNNGISENTNEAIKMATGDYIAFLDHDDFIEPNALFEIVSAIQKKSIDIIYTDEDFVSEDGNNFSEPYFKPDWSPYLLRSHNYITHFLVIKKSLIHKVGLLKKEYDGAQDYDLILRCVEKTDKIIHISKVLYHWRICKTSVSSSPKSKEYAYDAGKKALEDHFRRIHVDAKVKNNNTLGYYDVFYNLSINPLISIIIPNTDHINLLKSCINSLLKNNSYKNIEIIIVDYHSRHKETFDCYKYLCDAFSNISVFSFPGFSNRAELYNYGVEKSAGEYLLFLDSSLLAKRCDSIKYMLSLCINSNVGVVGSKILNSNNDIYHAGKIVGFNGSAVNVFANQKCEDAWYKMRPQLACDYSAVSILGLMTSKSLFQKTNGFNSRYRSYYYDVDYCLRVKDFGASVIYCPNSIWKFQLPSDHFMLDTPESLRLHNDEVELLRLDWAQFFDGVDPFYNKNLRKSGKPYLLNIINDTLLYSIEDIVIKSKNNINTVTVSGWALSQVDNCVSYKVLEENSLLNISVTKYQRIDLFESGLLDAKDNDAGFILTFNTNNIYNNKLYICDSKYNVSINLDRTYIKRFCGIKDTDVIYENSWRDYSESEIDIDLQRIYNFKKSPKFSIVVPLFNTPIKFLKELVSSVKSQSYQNWELCFSNASVDNRNLSGYLKDIHDSDKRIKYVEANDKLDISQNTNEAIKIASGDYICFLDHDDLLAENALFECCKAVNSDCLVDIIYTDEDKINDKGKHFMPHFKSDFNIDMLRSVNYFCHFCVIRKSIIEKVGMLDSNFDGAQDYDLILRCVEETTNIIHIQKVLYHWRAHEDSTANDPNAKLYAFDAGKKAIQAHYDRLNIDCDVDDVVIKGNRVYGMYKSTYKVKDNPLVSIIIANKDHINDLNNCIKSLFDNNSYKKFEIIVVENNSEDTETFNYYKKISRKYDNVKVVKWNNKGFNYSAINNFGAAQANGDYFLFLNNDTEIIDKDSINHMIGFCQREDVGAVGAKLLYDDGNIQHAGVTIGIQSVAGHNFLDMSNDKYGYFSRAIISQDLSAVTAACILIDKNVFYEAGCFDEKIAVAFNDIDLCLRIRNLGYLVVYDADSLLYHYESKSRGREDSADKVLRFRSEKYLFLDRWNDILENGDEYYNPNLTLENNLFSLRIKARGV